MVVSYVGDTVGGKLLAQTGCSSLRNTSPMPQLCLAIIRYSQWTPFYNTASVTEARLVDTFLNVTIP